jgi:hypothetical protein
MVNSICLHPPPQGIYDHQVSKQEEQERRNNKTMNHFLRA